MLISVSGYHIAFTYYVFLGSSWLWKFLRLSLCLMTLTVLRSTSQIFCRMSHYCSLSNVFLMIRQGLWIFRRKTTHVKCHFHHIRSRVFTINVILHRLVLHYFSEYVSHYSLPCKFQSCLLGLVSWTYQACFCVVALCLLLPVPLDALPLSSNMLYTPWLLTSSFCSDVTLA